MSIEQRLEKLERQNKWMRRIGGVAVALVAAVFLMGQGKEKELPDLEVQSLTVKAKDGRITKITGGDMTLIDANGETRASLCTSKGGVASLGLNDDSGRYRVALILPKDGAPGFYLRDRIGRFRALLSLLKDGSPSLRLTDKDGKTRAVLGVTTVAGKKTAESTLTLFNAKGDVIWQAPKEK